VTITPLVPTGFEGELVRPGDPDYDEARSVYNAMIDRRPALIARCATPDDVASTIRLARENDLPLSVRGGGHNGPGFGVVDAGIVCDLSLMNDIAVDPAARTVRVGGGCTWGEVDRATHEHGLAVPSGIISTTGVGGLTLGGGHGYLTRKHGMTVDNLLSADVVLANGLHARASATENADLFWAIRGGGGNFGVVTSFEFRAHPVSTVVGGPMMWPIESTAEVMRFFRDLMDGAPRDLYGWLGVGTVPPAPGFPEALHMRKVVLIIWCHLGTPEEANAALEPARRLGPPLLDGVAEVPYPGLQAAFDELYPKGLQWYWRHDFVRELSDEAIERHQEFGLKLPTMHSTMHLYPIDGAVHDVGPDETAFGYRDCKFSQVIVGVDADPAKAADLRSFAVEYWEAMHPHSAGGGYVSMMMEEGTERVRASYAGNYERLARVKAAYDPDNVFRVNQNIVPA
jgi:FAD binding domain/Berberine and berberine like